MNGKKKDESGSRRVGESEKKEPRFPGSPILRLTKSPAPRFSGSPTHTILGSPIPLLDNFFTGMALTWFIFMLAIRDIFAAASSSHGEIDSPPRRHPGKP